MKNMKWKVVLALSLAVVVLFGVSVEAAVSITIKNNRNHNMSFAFTWDGFDEDYSRGWYNVKAGETRTITLSEVNYSLTRLGFGFYATGGGNTWKGKSDDEKRLGWIHPKEAFKFTYYSEEVVNPKSGMQKVVFRAINLKPKGEDGQNGTASLTFNP
jgi:hypothetical protein